MMTDEALPLEKPTILVVDDTPENLSMMSFLLKDLYKVKVANQGQKPCVSPPVNQGRT